MREYHKIKRVFTKETLKEEKKEFNDGVIKMLYDYDVPMIFTEKVDGTNIRINWNGAEDKITIKGRTSNSDIPMHLFTYLENKFQNKEMKTKFRMLFGDNEVTIYGEGYGDKIQNGGGYVEKLRETMPNQTIASFIVFDIEFVESGYFATREQINDDVKFLDLQAVPYFVSTLKDEVYNLAITKDKRIKSMLMFASPDKEIEGYVARPLYELRGSDGRRIIVKVKYDEMKDLQI